MISGRNVVAAAAGVTLVLAALTTLAKQTAVTRDGERWLVSKEQNGETWLVTYDTGRNTVSGSVTTTAGDSVLLDCDVV